MDVAQKTSVLRKELRLLRATECPPLSKMKKQQIKEELERRTSSKVVDEPVSVPESTPAPGRKKPAIKAMEGLKKVDAPLPALAPGRKKKVTVAPVPDLTRKRVVGSAREAALSGPKVTTKKAVKGSEEAKARMASARAAKKSQ